QRLRELFPRARGWEETPDAKIGGQAVDLLAKFRLGEHEQTMVVDVVSLGQPRQIRAAVTKLSDVRKAMPAAYPVAASEYIGSQNVVKPLGDLRWVERDEAQRIHLGKPADLLQAWCESYTYRAHEIASYFVPERVTRKLMADLARTLTAESRRYAFTLSAGLSL